MKTVPAGISCLLGAMLPYQQSLPLTPMILGHCPLSKFSIRYSVVVNKNQNNRKHKVRLFTDAGKENILFTVSGEDGKKYQLFVFDMDSKLVTEANVRNHETSVLNNLSTGNYLFEVLIDDEQIESGQLTVK
jgi:hypothetical protein